MMLKVGIVFTSVGCLFIIVASIFGFVIFPDLIGDNIRSGSALVNGSDSWKNWISNSHSQIKFYVFNVTNSDDFNYQDEDFNMTLFKFRVKEFGPFIYSELREKVLVEFDQENDQQLLKYREKITYLFKKDLSNGLDESDEFVIFNVPFISTAYRLSFDNNSTIVNEAILNLLANGETLFQKVSVNDLFFNGIKLKPMPAAKNEKLFPIIDDDYNNYEGYKVNGSISAQEIVIDSGINDSNKVGLIHSIDKMTKLNVWNGTGNLDNCNEIKGTDGTIFETHIKKSKTLHVFNFDMFRTISLEYEKNTKIDGISGYDYRLSSNIFQIESDEQNECYCNPIPDPLIKDCEDGLMRLFSIKKKAPIIVSKPHFLNTAMERRHDVDGLNPYTVLHESKFSIEPRSGALLESSLKIQISVEIQPLEGVELFESMTHLMLPVLWSDEIVKIGNEKANELKDDLKPYTITEIGAWSLAGVGIAFLVFGLTIFVVRRIKKQRKIIVVYD